MDHVEIASFWEGVLLMINKLKSNIDFIANMITFVFIFVKVLLFFAGLPTRLLEGNNEKRRWISNAFFRYSKLVKRVCSHLDTIYFTTSTY